MASVTPPQSDGNIADVLIENLSEGTVIEQYISQLVSRLRMADSAGDGLDRTDVELIRAKQVAQARASAVSQVLGYDLDGDFKVTRDEIARYAPGEERSRAQQVESTLQQFDSDGNGIITLAEAAATARERDCA